MTMPYGLASLVVLLSIATNTVPFFHLQQQGQGGGGGGPPLRPLQPLDDVLMLVLDKDKNNAVSYDKIEGALGMLELIFQSPNANDEKGSRYKALIEGVKAAFGIPHLIRIA